MFHFPKCLIFAFVPYFRCSKKIFICSSCSYHFWNNKNFHTSKFLLFCLSSSFCIWMHIIQEHLPVSTLFEIHNCVFFSHLAPIYLCEYKIYPLRVSLEMPAEHEEDFFLLINRSFHHIENGNDGEVPWVMEIIYI